MGDVACTTLRHTTMFRYSHANTPPGQSERTYYLSYFINIDINFTIFSFLDKGCECLGNPGASLVVG